MKSFLAQNDAFFHQKLVNTLYNFRSMMSSSLAFCVSSAAAWDGHFLATFFFSVFKISTLVLDAHKAFCLLGKTREIQIWLCEKVLRRGEKFSKLDLSSSVFKNESWKRRSKKRVMQESVLDIFAWQMTILPAEIRYLPLS